MKMMSHILSILVFYIDVYDCIHSTYILLYSYLLINELNTLIK